VLEERCRQGAEGMWLNVRLSVEEIRREQMEVEKTWVKERKIIRVKL
jgi:hypothetical protein